MTRSFRWALALAAIGTSSWSAAAPAPGPMPPPEDQDLGHSLFREIVEMKSTHDVGSTELAIAIRNYLLRAGFALDDVVVIAPPEHPTKGNVVVRYRGAGKGNARRKPVLFLGHLDVVDARPEDWSVDPFRFSEKDGFFYGRGTIDMKEGIAALVETLIRLKRERFTPERDIIVAMTADEEAGGDANGPAFLLKDHRDLIDAELAVNLDGGGGEYRNGKRLSYSMGTSEKTYVTYTVETTSPGGHGSLPGPGNPIYRLAAALGRLEAYKFPVILTATTRSNFAQTADLDPSPQSADLRAVAAAEPDLAAAERLSENVGLNAHLRTTCVATLISGGHAENALPQRAKATIQCRMMPGDSEANVQSTLVATLADPQIRLTLDAPPIISPESVPTPQIMKKATKVIHSMWPGVPVLPSMATGFSDGRQTRNAGIPTYDLSGIWADEDENRAHGRDERVGIREFDESLEYTYRLVKEFSKAK